MSIFAHALSEELHCDACSRLIGWGSGDLTCCNFFCPECQDLASAENLSVYHQWECQCDPCSEPRGCYIPHTQYNTPFPKRHASAYNQAQRIIITMQREHGGLRSTRHEEPANWVITAYSNVSEDDCLTQWQRARTKFLTLNLPHHVDVGTRIDLSE